MEPDAAVVEKTATVRLIFLKLFPPLAANDLQEMMQLMGMYPRKSDISWILYVVVISVACSIRAFALSWLSSPVTHLLGVYPDQLGEVSIRAGAALGLGQLICLCLRLWVITNNLKRGGNVEYHQLVQNLPHEKQQSALRVAKVNYLLVFLSGYCFLLGDQVYMLLQSNSAVQIVSHVTWLAINVLWVRIIGVDLLVTYVVAFAAYSQVQANCNNLLRVIDSFSPSEEEYESNLRHMYERAMKSLAQFKDLSCYMKLSGDLMVVPTFSCILYTIDCPTTSNYDWYKKVSIAVSGVYCLSGAYIVPAIWSGVCRKAAKMYVMLNSSVCRGPSTDESVNSFRRRVSLQKKILEDIACSRTHLAVAEYNEEHKITSMDVLVNLLATFQFLMLIFDFS